MKFGELYVSPSTGSGSNLPLFRADVKGRVCDCDPSPSQPPKIEPCRHAGLTLTCAHGRKVVIAPEDCAIPKTLSVVAGPDLKPETIKAITKIIEGPCSTSLCCIFPHKNRVLDVTCHPGDGYYPVSLSDEILDFEVRSIPLSILHPLDLLWPNAPEVRNYTTTASTCYGSTSVASVTVYPDIRWTAAFSLGIKTTKQKTKESFFSWGSEVVSDGLEFSPSGSLTAASDGNPKWFEFKIGETQSWTGIFKAVATAADVSKFIQDQCEGKLGVKTSIEFPSFKLNGDWYWKENADAGCCDYCYDLSVGFSPLLGATVESDILEFLLQKLPAGVGSLIVAAKKKAKSGVSAGQVKANLDLSVVLKLSGKVSIEGTVKHNLSGDGSFSATGGLTGKISASVKGQIKGDGEFIVIKASAEASIEAEAALTGKLEFAGDGLGPYAQGTLDFTGLVVKAIVKYSVDLKSSTKTPPKLNEYKQGGSESISNKNNSGASYSDELENWSCTIIDKRNWLDSGRLRFLG